MSSPPRAIAGLDHAIIGVRDLDAARAGFARLGFNSSPRGRHIGWGTGNYCIMLENDYIELLGIVDASQFTNGLDRFLEQHQGLMGLVISSSDPCSTHEAWQQAGLKSAEFRSLKRLLESAEGDVEVKFENVMLDRSDTAGLSLFACHHLTPELMRQPGWTRHPVTATRVRSVTAIVNDCERIAAVMETVFGSSAITRTDHLVTVHAGRAAFLFGHASDVQTLHPAFEFDPSATGDVPMLTVLEVGIADPVAARCFLVLQWVRYGVEADGALTIQPEDAFGVAIELTPER